MKYVFQRLFKKTAVKLLKALLSDTEINIPLFTGVSDFAKGQSDAVKIYTLSLRFSWGYIIPVPVYFKASESCSLTESWVNLRSFFLSFLEYEIFTKLFYKRRSLILSENDLFFI